MCFRHQLTKKPLSDMLKAELTMQKLLIIGNHFVRNTEQIAQYLVKTPDKVSETKVFFKIPIVIFRNISNFATY